jgi:hypothetical protein
MQCVNVRGEVEVDHGTDASRGDPASSAGEDPKNDASRVDPASTASRDLVVVPAPLGTLFGFASKGCFLLDLICFSHVGSTSAERVPPQQETVLVESGSEDSGEEPPAKRVMGSSSRASP